MEGPCWLSVVMVAFVSIPALGSECTVCVRLNKGRLLDCLELCKPPSQTPRPDLVASVLNASEENELFPARVDRTEPKVNADRRRSYLMEHFRWSKPYRNKTQEPRAGSRDAKRGYSMEHFRWGKPPGNITPGPKLGQKGSKRSPYAMEHFRWGKPTGRKRKPVKTFTFPDNGASTEAIFHSQPRRQRNGREDANQISTRRQERKLRLRPRNADVVKSTTNNPQGTIAGIFRDILLKDVQRIMG
ncbi:pro-opiomelanocortin-like [Corythoichthys intestinalis]|uniref:pro-opiomelanocortin-like n=1 Tax=Corythoichthys intestinalis TaxID=161448 RepID=UPI0025A68217|nr:pro-opiomelanocortin-like [Corythoichthys intestinalis]XP_057679595.1 pro-opiomelanocortin-like [Corythoichthys intestinalis]XP_061806680.1 pro-opiomelanocortin-like [Nerophis lumbriciformis]